MSILADTGVRTRASVTAAGYAFGLGMRTVASIIYLPRRLRFTLDHAFAAGVRALPVTAVVALFAGMILALQTGIELRNFGQRQMIGTITALSMCREMGPFITAIILAATVGSSMAAEIGTMKVSDEVTALDVMSVDSDQLPGAAARHRPDADVPDPDRVRDLIGIVGGSLVGQNTSGVSPDLLLGLGPRCAASHRMIPAQGRVRRPVQGVIFGFTIATVSCCRRPARRGRRARRRPRGAARGDDLDRLIIVFGYIITWFFYFLLGLLIELIDVTRPWAARDPARHELHGRRGRELRAHGPLGHRQERHPQARRSASSSPTRPGAGRSTSTSPSLLEATAGAAQAHGLPLPERRADQLADRRRQRRAAPQRAQQHRARARSATGS